MTDTTQTPASELTGEELDRRAAELEIEGRSSMSADEKREAVAKAESSQSEGDQSDQPKSPEEQRAQTEAEARAEAEEAEDPEEAFRAQQRAEAAAQNLTADNAVPERRPQASQQIDRTDGESDLTRRLREAGDPNVPVDEPMGKEAYDRAQAAAESGEVVGETEGLMVGNVARATKGPHEGRVFAITRVLKDGSVGDMIRRVGGDPTQLLNSPAEVEATALGDERDGERLILDVEANGLVKENEGFRGTRAGRLH